MFLTGRLAPFRFLFNAIARKADGGQEELDDRILHPTSYGAVSESVWYSGR